MRYVDLTVIYCPEKLPIGLDSQAGIRHPGENEIISCMAIFVQIHTKSLAKCTFRFSCILSAFILTMGHYIVIMRPST